MVETDVVVVGAGPTGLTLARELRLAGVRVLVFEKSTHPWEVPKAGGLGGRILQLLRYRGLIDRFEAAGASPVSTPRFPFGGLPVDLTGLDSPMQAMLLPQPRMEGLLEELAAEAGADVRRGHEVLGLTQDDTGVTVDVRGDDGPLRVSASYLVGCDGVGSRTRSMAGIDFLGIDYPEVHRLGSFPMPDSVTLRDDGDYEIPGLGHLRAGYTQTDGGIFAISSYTPDDLGLYTCVAESDAPDDDAPMSLEEFGASVQRVLGTTIALREPRRLTRFTYGARHVDRYRAGRVLVAGDAAHRFPSGGVAVNAGMLDAVNLAWKLGAVVHGWAPDDLLDTYHVERHLAGARTLQHTQAQVALRRGLDPAADALRKLFGELLVDEAPRRRLGEFIAGADVRYPASGTHPLAGAFVADLPGVGPALRAARPVLLDLAGRADLRDGARPWDHRVDVCTAVVEDRPADALLLRPDAHVAWAAAVAEPAETAVPALREALRQWFGEPRPGG